MQQAAVAMAAANAVVMGHPAHMPPSGGMQSMGPPAGPKQRLACSQFPSTLFPSAIAVVLDLQMRGGVAFVSCLVLALCKPSS
eukprot:scaffold49850_cov20-Tisochrysis_lutea.AAC.2